MDDIKKLKQYEVDANYEFFKSLPYEEVKDKVGKYALLKSQTVKGYFSTYKDAITAGRLLDQENKLFSIQKVGEGVRKFGFFSAQ